MISCKHNNDVKIHWYSLNNNDDPNIILSFKKVSNPNKIRRIEFKLEKDKTNNLSIPLGFELLSIEYNLKCSYVFYPRLEDYSDLTKEIELYLLKANYKQEKKAEYIFTKCQLADGYFLSFEKEGELFVAVSKDNIIDLKNIKNISIQDPSAIIPSIQQNDILIDEGKYNNSILDYGYIIKSRINGNTIWLPIQ